MGLVLLACIHLTKEKCCKKALIVLTYKLPRENMSLALLQGEPLRTSVCYLQEYCLFLNHGVRNL